MLLPDVIRSTSIHGTKGRKDAGGDVASTGHVRQNAVVTSDLTKIAILFTEIYFCDFLKHFVSINL